MEYMLKELGAGSPLRGLTSKPFVLRSKELALKSLEQVTGVEPVSRPWQGRIIAAILYLRVVKEMRERDSASALLRAIS